MEKLIRNFRDMGGIKVSKGRIKPHKLLRGAALHDLDDTVWNTLLNEYELKTIVDFRSSDEIEKAPNDVVEGVQEIHIDIMSQARENADPNEMRKKFNKEISKEHMRGLNRMFVDSNYCRDEYRNFFDVVLEPRDGSLYFHCTAGKDRTGFAAAQILKILGATEEAIYEDYMRTNILTHDFVENRLKEIKVKENLTDAQINNIRGYMTVDPSYLGEAFTAIDERYGSFDNYIKEGLELSTEDIQKLREFYVEDII